MSSTENETKLSIPKDFTFESWEDETLNLKNQLLRGLYAFGFDTPSPIQKKAVGPMISMDKEGKLKLTRVITRGKIIKEENNTKFLKLNNII